MRAAVRLAAWSSLGLCLTGCLGEGRAGQHDATSSVVARVVGVAEAGSDVGNDRPLSSYDGRMVRRREVLALRIDDTAALPAMHRRLARAARHSQLTVSTISSGVLAPVELDRLAPDLVVSLPPRTTPFRAEQLMRLTLRAARRNGVHVQGRVVASVLVHDLRFTLDTAHPAEVSRAIDREGILADALGSYTTRLGRHRLDIVYTGPLLGDSLLRSVRRGIARPARVAPGAVAVSPRSPHGHGVRLADEPPPPSDDFSVAPDTHDHH